jgi:hypothetical protein
MLCRKDGFGKAGAIIRQEHYSPDAETRYAESRLRVSGPAGMKLAGEEAFKGLVNTEKTVFSENSAFAASLLTVKINC